MAKPLFQRTDTQLEKWRMFYNVLRGLSMRRVLDLIEEADRGCYADVMWMMRKIEKRNETVRACKARLLSEISKLKWSIGTTDVEDLPKGVTEAMVKAQQEFLKDRYDAIENLKEGIRFLALADVRGFSHLEKNYGADGNVVKLEPVPQWHWMRDGLYGDWRYNAQAKSFSNADQAEPVEIKNFILRECDDAWFEIALIRSFRATMGDKDFDGFVEDYGIPWLFLISPPSGNDTKQKEFQQIANDVVGDGRGVLPSGSDVKGPPGNPAANAEVFAQYLRHQEERIVLAATGGLLTMLTAPGSGTLAGSAHQEAWENVVGGVAQDIEETLQEQFDKVELAIAFPGQPVLAWFQLAYPEAAQKPSEAATTIKTMNDAGYRVKRDAAEEAVGLELEEESPQVGSGKVEVGTKLPPSQISPPTLKNRFAGGPPQANDSTEALQLANNALAEVLQVGSDYLAPIQPDLNRLIQMAGDQAVTLDDFAAAAADIAATFPELMDALPVSELTTALESTIGPAAVMGQRGGMRQQSIGTKATTNRKPRPKQASQRRSDASKSAK